MSSMKRISKVIIGFLMLAGSIILLLYPEDGYIVVVLAIDITLLLYGIRMLVYYFTLARYMVGGIMTLYKSIIVIDFGLFMFSLSNTPYKLVMLYLVGVMAFNGAILLLSAIESKRLGATSWKTKLLYGGSKIALAACCLFLWDSPQMVTYVYCFALIQSALYTISSAFRKSAIIYIE